MLITWPTTLTHYITVDVEGAEDMTEAQIRDAISNEECSDLQVESPSLKEIFKTGWYDVGDEAPLEKGGDPTGELLEAKASGKVIQTYYS